MRPKQPDSVFSESQKVSESLKSLNLHSASVFSLQASSASIFSFRIHTANRRFHKCFRIMFPHFGSLNSMNLGLNSSTMIEFSNQL